MSSKSIIEVDDLGKHYSLGERQTRSTRLGEMIADRLRGRREAQGEAAGIWALRDVSLSVMAGDVLGLVGRNGAGKSTFLKILAQITTPTEGRAVINGRLGSLLEVGTGFHPELTGRENVLLNGAILGMSRSEIATCLPEIVDFAEMHRFIDTPVKRYSSGMYMRLAFSVAAFLRTEILLVDEVLAVGDMEFQQRCLGKMSEISTDGRTVVFVSHNLGAVAQLCNVALWLDSGLMRMHGDTDDVLAAYTAASSGGSSQDPTWESDDPGDKPMWPYRVAVGPKGGPPASTVDCDDGLEIQIGVEVRTLEPGSSVAFLVRNARGVVVVSSDITHANRAGSSRLRVGRQAFRIVLPSRLLSPDRYFVSAVIRSPYLGDIAVTDDACSVEVIDTSSAAGARRAGVVGYNLVWEDITG